MHRISASPHSTAHGSYSSPAYCASPLCQAGQLSFDKFQYIVSKESFLSKSNLVLGIVCLLAPRRSFRLVSGFETKSARRNQRLRLLCPRTKPRFYADFSSFPQKLSFCGNPCVPFFQNRLCWKANCPVRISPHKPPMARLKIAAVRIAVQTAVRAQDCRPRKRLNFLQQHIVRL